jgi:hypothetical protein
VITTFRTWFTHFPPRTKEEQDRQCANNVTVWRVHTNIVQWKCNEYYTNCVCICSLRYPAWNAHSPYCNLRPAPLYNIFPHYLIKARFSKKILLNIKWVFRVSLQSLAAFFFILRRTGRDMIKNARWSSCKVQFILFLFKWNLNFLGRLSKNTQIPNFMKTRPVESSCFMRTGRHNEANSRFLQFCERA